MPEPILGSYSIDPAVFGDTDETHYIYFGGLWGGQLQRYKDNKLAEGVCLPTGDELALPSRVVRLSEDMLHVCSYQIGTNSSPNMYFDCIMEMTPQFFDDKVLFYPLEKNFDLPAILV